MQQQLLLVPFFFPLSLNKKLSSLLFVKEEAAAAAAAEGAETHVHNKTPRDVVEMCDLPDWEHFECLFTALNMAAHGASRLQCKRGAESV